MHLGVAAVYQTRYDPRYQIALGSEGSFVVEDLLEVGVQVLNLLHLDQIFILEDKGNAGKINAVFL